MTFFNPLNAELNPICHLLALLGAHHILHVSEGLKRGVVTIWSVLYSNSSAPHPPKVSQYCCE